MSNEKQFTHMVWRERMTFDATTTAGHHLVVDAVPPNGDGRGPKPIELVLTALAGCTAMDVLSILQKKREPVQGLSVDVVGTRADTHPMIYSDVEILYRVRGDVSPASVERAIELSATRYCGVHAMLEHTTHITTHFEIEPEIEPGTELEEQAALGPEKILELEHVATTLP